MSTGAPCGWETSHPSDRPATQIGDADRRYSSCVPRREAAADRSAASPAVHARRYWTCTAPRRQTITTTAPPPHPDRPPGGGPRQHQGERPVITWSKKPAPAHAEAIAGRRCPRPRVGRRGRRRRGRVGSRPLWGGRGLLGRLAGVEGWRLIQPGPEVPTPRRGHLGVSGHFTSSLRLPRVPTPGTGAGRAYTAAR